MRVAKWTCKWFQRAARANAAAVFVEPRVVNGGEMFPDEWAGAAVGGGQQVWFMEESEAGDSVEPLQMFTCGLSAQWVSRHVFTRDSQDVVPFHRNITYGNQRFSAGVCLFVSVQMLVLSVWTKTPNLIHKTRWGLFHVLVVLEGMRNHNIINRVGKLNKGISFVGFSLWIIELEIIF